jgi:hypothetical protein
MADWLGLDSSLAGFDSLQGFDFQRSNSSGGIIDLLNF